MGLGSFTAAFNSPIPDDRYSLCCGNKNLVNVGMGSMSDWQNNFMLNIGSDLAELMQQTLAGMENYNLSQAANALYAKDTHSRSKQVLQYMYQCLNASNKILNSPGAGNKQSALSDLTSASSGLYNLTGRYSPPTLSPNLGTLSGVSGLMQKSDALKSTTIYDTTQDLNQYSNDGIDLDGCTERLAKFIEGGITELESAMLDVSDVYGMYNGAVDKVVKVAGVVDDTKSSIIKNTFGLAKSADAFSAGLNDGLNDGIESGIAMGTDMAKNGAASLVGSAGGASGGMSNPLGGVSDSLSGVSDSLGISNPMDSLSGGSSSSLLGDTLKNANSLTNCATLF